MGIGQAQEGDIFRTETEDRRGPQGLGLAQRAQGLGRVQAGLRVRPATVADHDQVHAPPGRPRRSDQAAAAQALVIGVRGDDHEATGSRQIVEARDRQPVGGGEKGVGTHQRDAATVAGAGDAQAWEARRNGSVTDRSRNGRQVDPPAIGSGA